MRAVIASSATARGKDNNNQNNRKEGNGKERGIGGGTRGPPLPTMQHFSQSNVEEKIRNQSRRKKRRKGKKKSRDSAKKKVGHTEIQRRNKKSNSNFV